MGALTTVISSVFDWLFGLVAYLARYWYVTFPVMLLAYYLVEKHWGWKNLFRLDDVK